MNDPYAIAGATIGIISLICILGSACVFTGKLTEEEWADGNSGSWFGLLEFILKFIYSFWRFWYKELLYTAVFIIGIGLAFTSYFLFQYHP